MAWLKGPMPHGTWGWGAVVSKAMEPNDGSGFLFADFRGDKVKIGGFDGSKEEFVAADQVSWYDNSLTLPPKE